MGGKYVVFSPLFVCFLKEIEHKPRAMLTVSPVHCIYAKLSLPDAGSSLIFTVQT